MCWTRRGRAVRIAGWLTSNPVAADYPAIDHTGAATHLRDRRIHGCRDLLDRMIEEIRSDLAAYPVEHVLTVTLGDYVDRGPTSRGVVERLARIHFQRSLSP